MGTALSASFVTQNRVNCHQDQPYYLLTYKVSVPTLTQLSHPENYAKAAEEYLTSRSGPLTTNNAGEIIGEFRIPYLPCL